MNRLFSLIIFLSLIPALYGQLQIGQDIDGEAAGDYFGRSVSMSSNGSRIAIGASQNDGNGNNSGHARVFEEIAGGWVQLGQDIDGEAAGDASGLAVSLSGDGTTLAVGAFGNDQNGIQSGHVRIYSLSGGIWVQIGNDIDGDAGGDYFGWNVSINEDGSRLIIGAPYNDGGGIDAGHAKVFEYSMGNWIQVGADIQGAAPGDRSGGAVSISDDGSRVAVGAIHNGDNGINAGHARIFEEVAGNWVQLGNDLDGEAAEDRFGLGVALSGNGDRIVVGGHFNGGQAGHARVFQENTGVWSQIGLDIDGEQGGDHSGRAVAISQDGSRVAIGAYFNDGNGISSGHIRVFEDIAGSWTQIGVDIDGEAAGDYFGAEDGVAMSADGVRILGAGPLNGVSGSARVFSMDVVLAKISEFYGRQVENEIELRWKLNEESAFQKLELERSADTHKWERLETIEFQQNDFQFWDHSPYRGRNYYKINLIDLNGGLSYSNTIDVFFTPQNTRINIFPNPSDGTIQLSIPAIPNQMILVTASNMLGQFIFKEKINPERALQPFSLPFPENGSYILKIKIGEEVLHKHLIVNKK